MTAGKGKSGKPRRQRSQHKKAASLEPPQQQIRTQSSALLQLSSASNPNPKTLGPFSDRARILVVGDGDFSFSLALALYLGGRNITATCYDSQEELHEKYSTALTNASALEMTGASVYFDVDATALEKQPWIHREDKFGAIAFNFPHLGGATEEDVGNNQQLLRGFFCSARPFLHETRGVAMVALRDTVFYQRWKVEEQAQKSGYKLKRVEEFDSSIYSGYQPQRTHPASFRGEPPSTQGAKYYIFSPSSTMPVTQEPRVTAPHRSKTALAKSSQETFTCEPCSVSFPDLKKYTRHMHSAKHARKLKRAAQSQTQ